MRQPPKPTTAFGENEVAGNTAFIQASPVYGLIPQNFKEFSSLNGQTGITDRMFTCQSGTTIYGYAAIQSFRSLNYKAGQGGMARFTAVFQNSVANHWSGVGLLNLTNEFSFGYNGTTFGIWHRKNGVAECRTITVSGASGGSTNLTLTLNSVAYTIPLTSGTTAHNAYQIAAWLNNTNNQSVWVADQVASTVIIIAQSDGAKEETYSFSHATATGSIDQNNVGVTKTSVHIPQTSWNNDPFSSFDPTKGNVYQIKYQYLGFGNVQFSVEDFDSGYFIPVHTIKYTNNNTTPSISQPSLRLGMYSASVGSTTNVTVQSASMAGFVQGIISRTRNPRAVGNTQSVSTTLTNILTIKNRQSYNSILNEVEIQPLLLSVSSESTKNVIIEVLTNPTFSGDTNFASAGTNLVTDYDITANTVSGGTLLYSGALGSTGSLSIDLSDLQIRIPPSLSLCICAKVTSGASSNVSASVTIYEDV